jgi:uncharacterized protein YndB with AHSA1/START domain
VPANVTVMPVHALEIVKEEEIAAPIDVVFQTVLEQLGPANEAPDTGPIPMTLEAWPGGRWFRELGEGAGHWWGTVQAIKPPTLLEICGPLFMSYPATSNVQIRLSEEGGVTRLRFVHRAMGQIAHDPRIEQGWGHIDGGGDLLMGRIRAGALQSVR